MSKKSIHEQLTNHMDFISKLPTMAHAINDKGLLINVSDFWLKKMGYERKDVIGLSSLAFLTEESKKHAEPTALPEFINKGIIENVPYQFVKKDKTIIDVLLSASSILDEHGAFICSLATIIDVTEKTQTENQLKENDEQYISVFSQVAIGVARVALDGTFLEVNKKLCDIVGYSYEEMTSKTIQDISHSDDSKNDLNSINQLLEDDIKTYSIEKRYFHKNGHIIWINLSVSLKRKLNKEPDYFISVIEDITSRKLAEEKLIQYENVVSSTSDMMALLDTRFKYLTANQSYLDAFKITRGELINKTSREVFGEDFYDSAFRSHAVECLKGNETHYSNWFDFPGCGRCYMDISYFPYYRENKIVGFVVNGRNITDLKKTVEEKDIQLQLFHLISKESDLATMVENVLSLLKTWSAVDAIAIRLRQEQEQEQDFPYYKSYGFPEEFTQKEHSLYNPEYQNRPLKNDKKQLPLECMCGCVIKGLLDPSLPFFSEGGSFHTNSTSSLLSQVKDVQMPHGLRKHCNDAGYESILLIPLRVGKTTLGLIQFNHKEKDHFSSNFISLIEYLTGYISVAVAQRLAEVQLREKQLELEEVNSALKVIIRNREDHLLEHDRSIQVNIHQLVLPCIERVKLHTLNAQQKTQLNILESNLTAISSPFLQKMSAANIALTPTLAQVADMVKKGLTSKEIAASLDISITSVETYRKRIRTRLHLKNSNVNLRTYLINMD